MEETLREAPPSDDWRKSLAQTIEQQRHKVGQRIAGQRERLRELEGKIAQHLGEVTQELQSKQDAAREAVAKWQADEASAKQRDADLTRRELEVSKRESDLKALAAHGSNGSGKEHQHLLEDLTKRLTELDQRHAKVATEEKRLVTRQQELSLRKSELDQLQAGLSGQSAAHQSRADELARQAAELEKARQAHQTEAQRHQQQQSDVQRLQSELKLKAQSLAEQERETQRQRRHIAQQLRSRKKEQNAEILATGSGQEHELKLKLTELQGKLDRLREERDHVQRQLEQAQRKQSELESERQRLQTDLQRHLEEAGRKAEAARLDMARRTSESQSQATEIARLSAELDKVRRESQEQIDRLRADHGKSHDAQVQSLHVQLEELRKKILAEQATWETQRKQLEAQAKAAEQKAAQGGKGKGDGEAEKELVKLRAEIKQLESSLKEAEQQARRGGGGTDEDLKKRFEMAVQDVRELKTKNAELTEQLNKARTSGGGAAVAVGSDWESMKKRMMLQLADDFDEKNDKQKADKLTIEGAMKITDDVVAEKEKEIQELRRTLESQAQSVGDVAVGAAAIAQMLDSDELVRQERETLHKLQESLREQLKKAEIDISLERAKLARERQELDEKLRTIEAERPAPDEGTKGKKGGAGRRWLTRLGLGDSKGE
ncbi:MAG TPA: hypothetical protein VFB80_10040 [Pirellulaceae bacterium]|nr:hypothetical protein [Pirellulaceae bacterium]